MGEVLVPGACLTISPHVNADLAALMLATTMLSTTLVRHREDVRADDCWKGPEMESLRDIRNCLKPDPALVRILHRLHRVPTHAVDGTGLTGRQRSRNRRVKTWEGEAGMTKTSRRGALGNF